MFPDASRSDAMSKLRIALHVWDSAVEVFSHKGHWCPSVADNQPAVETCAEQMTQSFNSRRCAILPVLTQEEPS